MPWVNPATVAQFVSEKMNKVALFASERMWCDVYCLLPGQAQRAHAHDDIDKLYLVLSGEPTALLGEEERRLGPGQAAIAEAGLAHGLRNDGPGPATVLVCQARSTRPL